MAEFILSVRSKSSLSKSIMAFSLLFILTKYLKPVFYTVYLGSGILYELQTLFIEAEGLFKRRILIFHF